MTISKIYTCDICGNKVEIDIAARIKFVTDYNKNINTLCFCHLNDNSASERIICKKCIAGIKEAKWQLN